MEAKRRPVEPRRPAGRPRDPDIDQAILGAAVEVLGEAGLQGVTVSAVAQRAGVARATIYLRWPTREALLGAMARAAGGGFPYPMTGDLEADLRAGAAFARTVVAGEHFVALLPELVTAVLAQPPELTLDDLAPNRAPYAATYRASAAAQGAPQAIQCADRFHLLKNLREAVEGLLAHHLGAHRKRQTQATLEQSAPEWRPKRAARPAPQVERRKLARREERLARDAQVIALRQQGLSRASHCPASGNWSQHRQSLARDRNLS